jgi:hypothetical protein
LVGCIYIVCYIITVLVEIGPEGGRRHNNPLNCLPSSEGDAAEGPLGVELNSSRLILPC